MVTVRAFLVPGAMVLLLVAVWSSIRGHKLAATGAVLAALIALLPPCTTYRNSNSAGDGDAFLKVAQMNVMQENSSFSSVVQAALSSDADLLSVQEVDPRWRDALVNGLSDTYPYHLLCTDHDHYGIALFSRTPLEQGRVFNLFGLSAIRAVVLEKGRSAQVFAVHLRSPEAAIDLLQRDKQWTALASLVASVRLPTIVIGDLNTVPWDEAFVQFSKGTSMADGPWTLAPTWPSIACIALIPLDHILTSSELRVKEGRTFKVPGSDHRGISASITWMP